MHANFHVSRKDPATSHQPRAVSGVNQRRSQRILLSVAVDVSGKRKDQTAFQESTTTIVVSAHGALVTLREPVVEGQTLQLKNLSSSQQVPCTVRDVAKLADGSAEVGIEFDSKSERFWHVSFPPADWTPRSPEAKRFAPNAGNGRKPAPSI
jgi:hypothetical protein